MFLKIPFFKKRTKNRVTAFQTETIVSECLASDDINLQNMYPSFIVNNLKVETMQT